MSSTPRFFNSVSTVNQNLDDLNRRWGKSGLADDVNRRLKVFRILAERYRNRRKRFGLRLNLIAAILNFELASPS